MTNFIARSVLGVQIILLFSTETCQSFTTYHQSIPFKKSAVYTKISLSSQAPLSSEEIANQAQQIKESIPTSMFEESLVEDMTRCVKLLGKRVDNGPGSLSVLEIEEMNIGMQRIMKEMEEYASGSTTTPGVCPVKSSNVIDVQPEAPEEVAAPLEMPFPTSVTPEPEPETPEEADVGYGAAGVGFGLANDTTNTYVIPGMDEMTPEEYRTALQESVSARQSGRKDALGSNIGNRQSQNYLDNLGNPNRFQN